MYYKMSPKIIVILVILVILICGVGITLVLKKGKNNSNNVVEPEVSDILPTLNLSANTDEENQEEITITAVATTEDELGICSIKLPDDSINRSDKVNYVVNKNGNYTFEAKGNNGKKTVLTIEIKNIREASSNSPYMPTGFSHLGGEVENGYVIQDKYGNQYVWVPVQDGKMIRNSLMDNDYEESNSTASALVNSVAQNYGFYIGRFEASAGEIDKKFVATSIGDRNPWTNVTYTEAYDAALNAANVFGYEEYKTAILNSYAWDTAISWIEQTVENYSSNISYGNYSGNIKNTGTTESDIKNNICDLAGNVREWTTEIYKTDINPSANTTNTSSKNKNKNDTNTEIISETITHRVIRGGSANLNRTASSHTGYKENLSDADWGFRMILYK